MSATTLGVEVVRLLPWVVPPLLGAIIGYVTNSIAVRMLFRPLRAWYIGPLRVPFTPGVIPRQRDRLARSIGRMVSKELLTADVFERRFASGGFLRSLQRGVVAVVDRISKTNVGTLADSVALVDTTAIALEALFAAIDRDEAVRSALLDGVDRLALAHRERFTDGLSTIVRSLRPCAGVAPATVDRLMSDLWPGLAQAVEAFLKRPAVRQEVETRTRRIIRYTLDQLSDVQRLFVGVGQYDRRLLERVPEIVDRSLAELVSSLREPDRAEATARIINGWLDSHRDDTLETLLPDHAVNGLAEAIVAFGYPPSALLKRIGGERIRAWVASGRGLLVDRLSQFVSAHRDDEIATLAPRLLRRRASIARAVAPTVQRMLAGLTATFVAQLDVEKVVVERIDQLDVERVEGLLLGIIREHVQWINVFGAMLGALIGAAQIALRLAGL